MAYVPYGSLNRFFTHPAASALALFAVRMAQILLPRTHGAKDAIAAMPTIRR